jgi:hypothetical protein
MARGGRDLPIRGVDSDRTEARAREHRRLFNSPQPHPLNRRNDAAKSCFKSRTARLKNLCLLTSALQAPDTFCQGLVLETACINGVTGENNMPSSHSDFDFLHGSWNVQHRRLKQRLKNSDDWEEFDGTSSTRPVLGGFGNIEDNVLNFPDGLYKAIAIRSFDRESHQWAIWWLDERRPHNLDVPVVGSFKNGIGTFISDDVFEGAPIKVRFLWSQQSSDVCLWQQAFSADGGVSWETNWVMEFTRGA